MDKPVIIHVIGQLEPGGTELSLVTLLPHLQQGFDNRVCCLGSPGPVAKQLEDAGITTYTLNYTSRFDPRAVRRLALLLKTVNAGGVVTYLPHADLIGRLAARRCNLPVVSSQRSSLYGRSYLRLPDKLTSSLVSEYIVQTDRAARYHRGATVTVIPNAVAARSQPNREQARSLLRLASNDTAICCVSNLRKGKGHDTLLEALHLLADDTTWKAFFVGDGPLRSELESAIDHLKLRQRVQLLGHRADVDKILAAADLFVFPSFAEGMSNALLEALAAGLPVVASDIDANRAIIDHRENGLLVKPGDASALASCVREVLESQTLRTKLGGAATERAASHHNVDDVSRRWQEVLTRVTNT